MSCCCGNILYWNGSSQVYSTINTDVLLATSPSILMPEGTLLPFKTLKVNGDTIVIELFGSIPNNSNRDLKLKIGTAAIQTIWSINGVYTNPIYRTKIYLTRESNTRLRWQSETMLNATQSLVTSGSSFITELTSNQPIELYINQSVANSLQVGEVKITKFLN